ncbi:MAG: benzoyl-CoA 2,3-epoxidase subunit BoxB [Deltaproteobacteria bacterium]|nr:benzoyl-CoA 2,3-epoxidase subunit BoxB [Deltaproteobacteria bacterium]
MSKVDLEAKIPNNVDLGGDRRLQRALEKWQPRFLDWWSDMGPEGFQAHDVYLRTAIDVGAEGWAHFDHVKMPDYRWGIFLSDPEKDRTIPVGDDFGKPVWQEVPGEHRNALRRLIVTQGDTEPASVEQQRLLGQRCPSLYDLRNLFQVNVEEGRHLWAMVYLLHTYFGRDGREEAEALLDRRSGDADRPRILGAFNEPITDWLDFFMFTMFTDRDGKYQLLCLAESAFDPLSRTCRFMLTEEAHHMFVGDTGIGRVVRRAIEIMKEHKTEDVRAHGGIDLPTIQKHLNFWFTRSVDLFGGEVSTNAANYFAAGLKGRAHEKNYDDHVALAGFRAMDVLQGGELVSEETALRLCMNEYVRDGYIEDCQKGVDRWNKILEKEGMDFRFALPDRRFNREIGVYAGFHFTPEGERIDAETWAARRSEWLPTAEDKAYISGLQEKAVLEPGKMAAWIAPPSKGINGQAEDFEYVRA